MPIAGYATMNEHNEIELTGLVASADGHTIIRETVTGTDPEAIGTACAKQMADKGAKDLIDKVKKGSVSMSIGKSLHGQTVLVTRNERQAGVFQQKNRSAERPCGF
ncbi:hypothetical protein BsIDN1_48810 [Bacillus safensis]|uniref:Porphobilinogen deaminase C-terminal domain-containing protein n=1 Tax=Bacillus safensis TaxID=561879 RepID=A0A5S9MDT5_BACIA|nr:hypothetical protein BsIDN1_48810 [Bacillus safensis]